MGTGSVFAAEVQTGYTPDMNATATADTATTDDTTTKAAVYNAGTEKGANTQDNTDAAILAARGDTTLSTDGTVVQGSDGTVTVNNGALKTDDKQVKMVSKTTAGTDLDKVAENGQAQAVTSVEAQYVTAVSADSVNPFVGKTITGLSISGIPADQAAQLMTLLSEKVGDAVSVDGVFKDVQNLGNSGYFSEVNPVFTSVPEGVKIDFAVVTNPVVHGVVVIIEIDVLEHKTGTITLGAGYSKSDGLMGIVEFGEDNLRGTGDKFKVHWEIGGKKKYKNYQISYLKPWIDHRGTSLGFSFFNREDEYTDYDSDGSEVAEYNKKSKGFNISFGRQTGEYTRDYLTLESRSDKYKWDNDDSSGFRYDAGTGAGPNNRWNNGSYDFAGMDYVGKNFGRINSISWQKVYDSRDNIYEPTRGRRISYTAQWAGHGLGGDFDFYKFTAEMRAYKKVGSKNVLAFRARGGFIQGDAPYSQLFTLGGADTLRGYEDDQFRGKNMYNATLEFRFPIVKKVSGVLFTDIGDAWDAPNVPWYKNTKSFNYGVGAGVRITTPIGPVKLDYGIGKDKKKFHFSFGTQF